MKKIIVFIFVYFVLLSSYGLNQANAAFSGGMDDERIIKLQKILTRHNSPLLPHANLIVWTSDKYQIPWTMIVSIAGVESTFCKHIPSNSYNCWGWNNGKTKFKDYPEAIETVSKTLKASYFDRGLNTPERISRVYAPPSSTWGKNVRYFTNLLER